LFFNDDKVRIIRLAIKSDASNLSAGEIDTGNTEGGCLMVTCVEGFGQVFNYAPKDNPAPNQEPKGSWLKDVTPNPIFTYYTDDVNTPFASSNTNPDAVCEPLKRVVFDTGSMTTKTKLNFIEMLLCLKNSSNVPCIATA
jgi:hypothetical protein